MPKAPPDTRLWGYDGPLTALRGGHRNSAFRTVVGHHPALVFKSSRRSAESLLWLDPVQAAAREAGFQVPKHVRSRRGHILENGWTCEPFIDGAEFTADRMPEVARRLERFHEATTGIEQRPGFASSVELTTVQQGGDVDLSVMPTGLVAQLRGAWAGMPDGDQGVIHGDIGTGNLILTPSGQPALIDWDEARVDLRIFDTAQVVSEPPGNDIQRGLTAWEIACCWKLEPERARSLAARDFGCDF